MPFALLVNRCQSTVRLHEENVELIQFVFLEGIGERVDVPFQTRRQIRIRTG